MLVPWNKECWWNNNLCLHCHSHLCLYLHLHSYFDTSMDVRMYGILTHDCKNNYKDCNTHNYRDCNLVRTFHHNASIAVHTVMIGFGFGFGFAFGVGLAVVLVFGLGIHCVPQVPQS